MRKSLTYGWRSFRFEGCRTFAFALVLLDLVGRASYGACPPNADFGFIGSRGDGLVAAADASVAMGSEFGIALSNYQIAKFTLAGGVSESRTFEDFFQTTLGFTSFSDAVVRFDTNSHRFFIVLQDTGDYELGLAVSTSSTPHLDDANDWYVYGWDETPNLHYHNIDIGDDYIYISARVSGDQTQPLLAYAPKADLLTGTQTNLEWRQVDEYQQNVAHHIGCVKDYDRVSDVGYFVTFSRKINQPEIRLYAVDPPATSATTLNLTVSAYRPVPDDVDTPGSQDFFASPTR